MRKLRTTGDLATRAIAVARELSGVIVCRSTAAWLWGLDVLPPGVNEQSWDVDLLAPPGLPSPQPQVPISHAGGRFYLDLAFPAYRPGVEYDGRENHDTAAELGHDRRRRALIRASGWEVVVVRQVEKRIRRIAARAELDQGLR